jgi:hypothetical protein
MIMGTMQEKEKEGRRDGRGGTRVGTMRKKREGRAHQLMLEREECEGVTRGATGGQKRGRNECRRGQKGRKRDQGRHNAQKSGGGGTPTDIGTGGVRESDE